MSNGFIRPMLANPLPAGTPIERYADGEWVAEEKFDGHRIVMLVQDGKVYAWSRYEKRRALPAHIQQAALGLIDGFYDGELVSRMGGKSHEVSAGSNTGKERLVLFDALHVLGGSLLNETYRSRREYLQTALEVLADDSAILIAPQLPVRPQTITALWDADREGVILKRLDSHYKPGHRSDDWLKVKRLLDATVRITAFEKGENGPYSVAVVQGDAGRTTKVKVPTNDLIRQISASPSRWVGQDIEINFQELTADSYRHPRWAHRVGHDS